ncbi:hypothetical protein K440DRAFT_618639 [Wilcoxina mikolae CBS 423.85]|nr:hypothetical protein K440DRAFT_618639 [Wilcoxina mikolae CBS 423.85]
MSAPAGQSQDPEVIRQWMSQNLMSVSSANGNGQPYPQIDPRLLGGSSYPPTSSGGYSSGGSQYQGNNGTRR